MLKPLILVLNSKAHTHRDDRIDDKYRCYRHKQIESSDIVLADAFGHPGTVVVVLLNAELTVLAVFGCTIHVDIAGFTVADVGTAVGGVGGLGVGFFGGDGRVGDDAWVGEGASEIREGLENCDS